MIDFIKIIIKNLKPSTLEANPLLVFFDNINLATGEIKTTNRIGQRITPYKNAFYNSLEFKIYETGTITMTGSLHKYWNNGAHNYNDFNIEGILWVLHDLKTKFNIEPEDCILKCLEIGINIIPPIPTNIILDNCFLHKTKPFEYQKNSDEGKYKQVQHSQYIIKTYNKALHYNSKGFIIDDEIMRFEIKYTKMEKLNSKGIFNLRELINYGLQNFKEEILKEWENVLFFDNTTRIDHLSTKLQNAFRDYSNPNYWSNLLSNNKTENFKHHRRQLKKIIHQNSDNLQSLIAEIMTRKIDLLNTKTTQIDPLIIMSKKVVIEYSITSINKVCKMTGLNISMQKNNSILLSHTGLKYYYTTDKKVFEQIKRKYLSKNWHKSNFETQIKEIAHNIRNTRSNQKTKQKKIYQPQQLNILELLKINP